MIRLFNCLRRRSELSAAEFRRYWEDPAFDALLARVAEETSADRYVRSLTLRIDLNAWLMNDRGMGNPFDGVVELCWPEPGQLAQLRESIAVQSVVDELRDYQDQFIDRAQSYAFFTESDDA